MDVKKCTGCQAEKPISEFYGHKKPHSKCKECEKKENKARYDANPEKYRAAVRESARKYPEKARARYQRWQSAHEEHRRRYWREFHKVHRARINRVRRNRETPEFNHRQYEQRREYFLDYGEVNKERKRANEHAWRQRYPEKHADTENRRRARKRNAPRIEKIDRQALIERDTWTCYLCGLICTPKNVTLDHVVSLFRGGTHTADNLHVACRSCNCRKNTKNLCDFLK